MVSQKHHIKGEAAGRSWRRVISRLFVSATPVLVAVLLWWGWVPRDPGSSSCTQGGHAAWIGVEWTSQPVDPMAVRALAERAVAADLRWLFPFTTYVKPDGSWSQSYGYASEFVAAYRLTNPQTVLLAWVGLPTTAVDFGDGEARARLVAGIAAIVTGGGFDGVHLNAEPLPDGDPSFLTFLEELRTALPPGLQISVATLPWASPAEVALRPGNPFRWSSAYYAAIAARADQLVVMAYDSHMPSTALYRLWMREQVRGVTTSIAGSGAELLIGVSLSREVTASHNPSVETLLDGLSGVCAGVDREPADQPRISGVALYAFWEATEPDWQIWERWQKPGRAEAYRMRWRSNSTMPARSGGTLGGNV